MGDSILVIEDHLRIAQWIQIYLQKAGFKAEVFHAGLDSLNTIEQQPDLVIFDMMPPSQDALSIFGKVRQASNVPILILTAKLDVTEQTRELGISADNCVTKPFNPDELIAKVQLLLRYRAAKVPQWLCCKPFQLNLQQETVLFLDQPIELPYAQFKLLETFVRHPNQVLSREQLSYRALHNHFDGSDSSIDSHISQLRKRVNIAGLAPIKTVYGAGYKFVPTD